MAFPRVMTADEAAGLIPDGAVVTVSSSSGLGCPDAVLAAIGRRFDDARPSAGHHHAASDRRRRHVGHQGHRPHRQGRPAGEDPGRLLSLGPVLGRAAGDLADGHAATAIPAYNIPSGILFDMHREAAAQAPGRADQGRARHLRRSRPRGLRDERPRRRRADRQARSISTGEDWLYFPTIVPDVAIIRATTADERGNLTYEHEGAYLGAARPGAGGAQQWRHRHRAGEARRRERHAEAA